MTDVQRSDRHLLNRSRKILRMTMAFMLLGTLWASSAEVGAQEKEPAWFYGTGSQYFDYGDDLFEVTRQVNAWVAPDGRYRVHVVSPNGASEEFIYDGTDALMFVTPPGEKVPSSIMKMDSAYLWAIDGHASLDSEGLRPRLFDAPERRDQRSSLPASVRHDGVNGASYELSMKWRAVSADESVLAPSKAASALLDGYVFEVGESEPSGPETRSVSSNSYTFYDNIYSEGPCVFAKNYRDAEDSYLRAYSSARGDCDKVGVTLRHGSQKQGGAGFCQAIGYLVSGTSTSGYKNYSLYTAWNTPTCTSHAGWYDGLQVVPYLGLSTNPWND